MPAPKIATSRMSGSGVFAVGRQDVSKDGTLPTSTVPREAVAASEMNLRLAGERAPVSEPDGLLDVEITR